MIEPIATLLADRDISYGNVYKYIADYGKDLGIIAMGLLQPIDEHNCQLTNIVYIKFKVPKIKPKRGRPHAGKTKSDVISINNHEVSKLQKPTLREYIYYSIIKKI
jgi:hypothetical protein